MWESFKTFCSAAWGWIMATWTALPDWAKWLLIGVAIGFCLRGCR